MTRHACLFFILQLAYATAHAHGGEDHSHDTATPTMTASGATPQRQADGSLFIPKAIQHQLGLRTRMAQTSDLTISMELNGRIIADPNASGLVQARQAGVIVPGKQGLPTLGQSVRRGETLAWLQPIANSIERSNQQTLLVELEAQLAVAASKLKRYEQLEGAIPQKEIDAAGIELASLKKRHMAVSAGLNAPEPLAAPVSGVIGASWIAAGQVVEAREKLFEIVDPARWVVEALAYDPGLAERIVAASANVQARHGPDTTLALKFIGGGRLLREQAVPLLFAVTSTKTALASGQAVKVIVQTRSTGKGIALPQSALTRNAAGEDVIWIHSEAERYAPRRVKTAPLDSSTIAIVEGLKSGERVVIEGASLLSQVR